MTLKKFENRRCDVALNIPTKDEYTFSVLSRILRDACALTVTDGEKLVVCHSSIPYPVWVWTRDDVTEDEKEIAYSLMKKDFDLATQSFNMKYSLADFVIRRAAEEGHHLSVTMNMSAYNCEHAIAPKREVTGRARTVTLADLDVACEFLIEFNRDLHMDDSAPDLCRTRAEELIRSGHFYLWEDRGEAVACCSYRESDDKCSINSVFTRRDKRRRGYAARLVYEVTETILSDGKMPVLYTDGDYAASNACYASIGYREQGRLCTVGAGK